MMEVKFCRGGKTRICEIGDENEYGCSGYQWRNILNIVAGLDSNYPIVQSIVGLINEAQDCLELVEDTGYLDRLIEALANDKDYRITLSRGYDFFIKASSIEDACKKALLELGHGEGQVIYIKDVFGNLVYGDDK